MVHGFQHAVFDYRRVAEDISVISPLDKKIDISDDLNRRKMISESHLMKQKLLSLDSLH